MLLKSAAEPFSPLKFGLCSQPHQGAMFQQCVTNCIQNTYDAFFQQSGPHVATHDSCSSPVRKQGRTLQSYETLNLLQQMMHKIQGERWRELKSNKYASLQSTQEQHISLQINVSLKCASAILTHRGWKSQFDFFSIFILGLTCICVWNNRPTTKICLSRPDIGPKVLSCLKGLVTS